MRFLGFRALALTLLLAACGDDDPMLSTTTVDFGQTNCGTTQVPRTLLLANPYDETFTFDTAFASGTHYMVQPTNGFLLPGQQIELTIFSAAIPAVSATTDNLYSDTLTITTNRDGDKPHEIAIQQTARGAILEFSARTVTIPGTHQITTKTTASLALKNVGNAPAEGITISTHGAFTFAPATIATIAAGEEVAGTVTYLASTGGIETESISVTKEGPGLCAPLPTPTKATGTGTLAGVLPTKIFLINGTRFRGNSHALFALLPGGYIASLGGNDRGLRGMGSALPSGDPTLVRGEDDHPLDGITDLAGERGAACALGRGGAVLCWGNDTLARNKDTVPSQPFAKRVVDSGATSVALMYGGRCIGSSASTACITNAMGTGAIGWNPTNAKHLSLHTGGGYAVQPDGTVVSFGTNSTGERGSDVASFSPPSPIPGLTDVKLTIAQSGRPTNQDKRGACALKNDGTVWCWGAGRHGRLGNGSTNNSDTPVQVMLDANTPLTGVTAISGTHGHRCALSATNMYCWGNGRHGKLGRTGLGDDNAFARPLDDAITGGISIATSRRGTCVLQDTGRIVCWGETLLSTAEQLNYDAFMAPPTP